MNKQPNSDHCFICGVKNVAGVHVAFYDVANGAGEWEVLARFRAQSAHQGYPGRMHGGVIAGILDEAIGRAINSGSSYEPTVWGVTIDLDLHFHHPVPLGVDLTARGRITHQARRLFEGSGELYLPDGAVAVSAAGRYIKLTLDQIAEVDLSTLGWRVYPDETAP